MRRALARHQGKLTEEVTSLHPPQVEHLAVGLLQQSIGDRGGAGLPRGTREHGCYRI
jgi:hypothetical protein